MKRTDLLKPGMQVVLLEMPTGYTSRDYHLTVGETYRLLRWNGSNVVITTDSPNMEASIHNGRVTA
jgi:hypothetical protein